MVILPQVFLLNTNVYDALLTADWGLKWRPLAADKEPPMIGPQNLAINTAMDDKSYVFTIYFVRRFVSWKVEKQHGGVQQ
jgi:hypothetical protein